MKIAYPYDRAFHGRLRGVFAWRYTMTRWSAESHRAGREIAGAQAAMFERGSLVVSVRR